MDSFTRAYMAATLPECGSLESIGSAYANWSRTSSMDAKDEATRFLYNSPLAESILASQGIVAYEAFLAECQQHSEALKLEEQKRAARRLARRAAIDNLMAKLKAWVKRQH
ncbi:hypothetical protein MMC19_003628 [Ptychographa xylographoides]|nr:hypothetical protein [Ptychographa xylographoides]